MSEAYANRDSYTVHTQLIDKSRMNELSQLFLSNVDQIHKECHKHVLETGRFLKGMGDGELGFVQETSKSVATAGQYYANALCSKVNLGADLLEFGNAMKNATGQALGTAGDYYLSQVPKGQTNLGNDIYQTQKAVVAHWNSLDPEQKGQVVGKEVVPLAVPGAIGIVAKEVQEANLIGKAGEAISALASSDKIPKLKIPVSFGPELQLAPVYVDGYVPKPFKPIASQIPEKEVNPGLSGMMAMSGTQDKIARLGSEHPHSYKSAEQQPKLDATTKPFRSLNDEIKIAQTDIRSAQERTPGLSRVAGILADALGSPGVNEKCKMLRLCMEELHPFQNTSKETERAFRSIESALKKEGAISDDGATKVLSRSPAAEERVKSAGARLKEANTRKNEAAQRAARVRRDPDAKNAGTKTVRVFEYDTGPVMRLEEDSTGRSVTTKRTEYPVQSETVIDEPDGTRKTISRSYTNSSNSSAFKERTTIEHANGNLEIKGVHNVNDEFYINEGHIEYTNGSVKSWTDNTADFSIKHYFEDSYGRQKFSNAPQAGVYRGD